MVSLAELLRELKERSGLSYGVLAKRLRVSTSTLHRYCNGDAVPAEFASVERFARLCEARPDELVEVHRRWILADAERRGRKPEPTATGVPEREPEPEPEPHSGPLPVTRRRRALALAATVAAVIGITSVTLAMNANSDDDKHRQQHNQSLGPPSPSDPSDSSSDRPGKSKGRDHHGGNAKKDDAKDKPDGNAEKSDPSAPPSGNEKGVPAPDAARGGGKGPSSGGARSADPGVPLTAHTRPYLYEGCAHSFLVGREPDEMPQPPDEQDVPAWAGELGAVPARNQHIAVTVQGTGKDSIVLRGMNVRVQSTGAPLAWNNFKVGTRCDDKLYAKAFTVDLDDATPRATPNTGQPGFPYKVSENDPQVFYITANTELHDVRWYLELEWSSGRRHDVLRVDDQGKPFRTSGNEGRPVYSWSGSDEWEREGLDGRRTLNISKVPTEDDS